MRLRCRRARRPSSRPNGGYGGPPSPVRHGADPEVQRGRIGGLGRRDEAREGVVRALAKLRTVASRAEAASAIAEAEIAAQSLRAAAGPQHASDLAQGATLLPQGSAEFAKQNYGGALYLANQAKRVAGVGTSRPGDGGRVPPRPGEGPFALPGRLQGATRGNRPGGAAGGAKGLFP